MTQLIVAVKRHPGLSPQQPQAHWRDVHGGPARTVFFVTREEPVI